MVQPTEAGPEIEREWRRIDKLLAEKSDAACALALIEAQKVFVQVLDVVSYGPTVDEKIHNAESLFGSLGSVLAAQNLYTQVVAEIGFEPKAAQTKKATEAILAAIIDLVGRDYEPKGAWPRMLNGLNFFWGHHPQFLMGLILSVLGFVAIVWFLADTMVGHFLNRMGVGFARFVIERPWLMITLVVILGISWIGHWVFVRRRRAE